MNLNDVFAPLYELWGALVIGQNGEFSFDLYLNGLYSLFGITAWVSVFFTLIIFYFAVDHPAFNRWYHMLIVMVSLSLINGIFAYLAAQNTFQYQGISYGVEYLYFSIVNFFFVLVSFGLFTTLFRITRLADISRNCSTCPFPN